MAKDVDGLDGKGDVNGSDNNQKDLEARGEALYEKLMEKQMTFKEHIEPLKTDNQNAGKV